MNSTTGAPTRSTYLSRGKTAVEPAPQPSVSAARKQPATTPRPSATPTEVTARTDFRLPAPLDYESITLLDREPDGDRISYTDCMESSCLRFVQAMLCDTNSLDDRGQPTRVDLDLVRARVPDSQVRGFFQEYPDIFSARDYAPGRRGFKAREAWARLVTHRPFFTYKRSACGVYKNEYLEGETKGSFRWATEME